MPNPPFNHPKQVLIVDQSDDSRDVIRTVLERRGVGVHEAPGARQGLEMLRQFQVDVVVLDLESDAADDEQVRAAYEAELTHNHAEMVILGNIRKTSGPIAKHLVPKPYHYGPLIRKIEQLIERSTDVRRAS